MESVKKSYVDVPTDPGVDTMAFLEATEGLVKMFGARVFWSPTVAN